MDNSKKLNRFDLTALAIGNVIGGGIMSLLGLAIGLTGRSVVISIAICTIMVFISCLPQIFSSGTMQLEGGFYTQASVFGGKKLGGLYVLVFVTYFFSASLYALSFASYVLSFFPTLNVKVISILLLTILLYFNIRGIKVAAEAQNIMVVLLIVALVIFSFFGLPHVKPGFFDEKEFITNGFSGIMVAASLMSFATVGSAFVVNFSPYCKNPTKDIPYAIIVSSVVVGIIYILVAVVASGVFPIEHVANKPLAVTAKEVLPYPLYLFFMIFGAMTALVTSLNALLGWITPPIMMACRDGWLPRWFGVCNKKYETPHRILLTIYFLTVLIILAGLNLSSVANISDFLSNCVMSIVTFSLLKMPLVIPKRWAKSKFKISNNLYYFITIIGTLMTVIFCYYMAKELSQMELTWTGIYLVVCLIYVQFRSSKVLPPNTQQSDLI